MDRIEYRLTEQDLVAFNQYYASTSDMHRRYRRRHRVLVPLVYLFFAALLACGKSYASAVVFAVFAGGWFLLSPRWMRTRYRKHYEKHVRETAGALLDGPMSLELAPDGIVSTSPLGESRYRYAAVDRLVEDGGYTYIFIGKGMALVLPHDRVGKAAIDSLAAEIERRRQAPPVPPAAPPPPAV